MSDLLSLTSSHEIVIKWLANKANGYGRTKKEAFNNGILNMFEYLLVEDKNIKTIKQALKQTQEKDKENIFTNKISPNLKEKFFHSKIRQS